MSGDPRPRAWRLLVETHGLLFNRLVDELREELDLPITWYDVLLHLEEVPGRRMRMNELAEAVVISKSGLTTLVDRMEEAGLLRRERLASDRRATEVALTPAGLRRFEEAAAVHRRGIREHFTRHLRPEDGRALADILERLKASAVDGGPA